MVPEACFRRESAVVPIGVAKSPVEGIASIVPDLRNKNVKIVIHHDARRGYHKVSVSREVGPHNLRPFGVIRIRHAVHQMPLPNTPAWIITSVNQIDRRRGRANGADIELTNTPANYAEKTFIRTVSITGFVEDDLIGGRPDVTSNDYAVAAIITPVNPVIFP